MVSGATAGLPPPSVHWKGCKPDSVLIAIYLCDLYPRLQRRGTTSRRLFGLAPDGVFHAADIAAGAVSSYLAFSPLPASALSRFGAAVCFLWHYPSGNHYAAGPRLREASRPVESGLSSPAAVGRLCESARKSPLHRSGLQQTRAAIRPSKLESKIEAPKPLGPYSGCQYRIRPQYSQLVSSSPCLAL